MGRGRAKAKQTKVARELKYSRHEPDFYQLQSELAQSGYANDSGPHDDSESEEEAESDR